MAKTSWAFATLSLLLSISACATDRATDDAGRAAGSDEDSGSGGTGGASGSNASHDAGADAYVWMPRDSGTAGSNSAGGSGGIGGSGGSSTYDSGLAGRMCAEPRMPLPDLVLPRCSVATHDCIAGCMTAADPEACRETCINADTTPAEPTYGLICASCIYLQLFACVDATDCHDGVAELFCCIEDNCPTGSAENCTELECGSELMAALTCGYYAKRDCVEVLGEAISGCFETPTDAGL